MKLTRRLRAPLVLAAASLVASLTGSPAVASAEIDAYAADGRDLAAALGIGVDEAAGLLRYQEAVRSLEATARVTWPDTFAGLWLDLAAGGEVTVAFTEDAAANAAALADGFARPDLVRGVDVGHSLADLERRLDAMIADREEVRRGRGPREIPTASYDLAVDVRRNAPVVRLARPDAAVAERFRARYGRDVVVDAPGLATPTACTQTDCRYGLRSGLRITNDSGGWCSTAFAARRWWNEWAMLTAGHCGHDPVSGQWASHGGQYYGYREAEQYSGPVDAEFHRVVYNGFYGTPHIYVDDYEQAREVRAKGQWRHLVNGEFVCKTGATTGKTCGFVQNKYLSLTNIPNSYHFVEASFCVQGGDSGSGVYSSYKARGIVHGFITGNNCRAVFGHSEYAEQALAVSIVTTQATPYLSSARGVAGTTYVDALFSDRINCGTVSASDFQVSITSPSSLSLEDSYASCSLTGQVRLNIRSNGAPFVLTPGMSFRVSLVSLVESEFGNEIPYPASVTRSVTTT